jgi:N-acetylneuraminate synthase
VQIKSNFFEISNSLPTYFIADIAANHDGDLDRAIHLIELAASSGANAAKFQHFRAETIVSKIGFERDLKTKIAHQSKWKRSVWDVYKSAEVPLQWTSKLIDKCNEVGLDFFTAPYDLEAINYFSNLMPFYKVGSGDLNYLSALMEMVKYKKPIFLATGASTLNEVVRTTDYIMENECEVVLMQCNTNYTGDSENLHYINLRVLNQYREIYPELILGLSDHTEGDVSVLGSVALGARVIEKHFTDDVSRSGPDHAFSMTPTSWSQMVNRTRQLEASLGDGRKKIEENEKESRTVQRRALRVKKDLEAGHILSSDDLVALRPMPENGIEPFLLPNILGRKLNKSKSRDSLLTYEDLT